jgi:hypothetical protein
MLLLLHLLLMLMLLLRLLAAGRAGPGEERRAHRGRQPVRHPLAGELVHNCCHN